MKDFRKILGLFIFVSLMFVKVSALHVYAHQDGDQEKIENCKICDLAVENQNMELNQVSNPEAFHSTFLNSIDNNFYYISLSIEKDFSYYLFSRPPPYFS
ncbi:hypothetical protein [Flagellimonas sp. CMM7]|uniref:hypothetical protein n=1 Tax=Flagellimonas sp. CMM7 TaxID=2654676 RepID=UPI001969B6CF|nr:hypothetical protein [Flagellimonas sp. CMM7]UII79713.1 hypothetical protein LV704_18885 [Flagellimonas sp. CMM7]